MTVTDFVNAFYQWETVVDSWDFEIVFDLAPGYSGPVVVERDTESKRVVFKSPLAEAAPAAVKASHVQASRKARASTNRPGNAE